MKMRNNYDNYNYSRYWKGRDYEHASEVMAIDSLLAYLPKVDSMADVGGGFGRLISCFQNSGKVKKITLVEPSGKLLEQARIRLGDKVSYIQSDIENFNIKNSYDLVSVVRVLHHIDNVDMAIDKLGRTLKKRGYLIMEFANKLHWKAVFQNMCCGNFTYPLEIEASDRNSLGSGDCLPFFNYHPDIVCEKLEMHGFKILKKRSVSNLRSRRFRYLPRKAILSAERCLQSPLARINFGPSMFILAQKE